MRALPSSFVCLLAYLLSPDLIDHSMTLHHTVLNHSASIVLAEAQHGSAVVDVVVMGVPFIVVVFVIVVVIVVIVFVIVMTATNGVIKRDVLRS